MKMITLGKKDIAIHQLNKAIEHFFEKDYISSITLSGASEEILGDYCKKENKENVLNSILKIAVSNGYDQDKSKKDVFNAFNFPRNSLKHADDGIDIVVLENIDPQLMILRAIKNYETLDLKPTEQIKKFKE